MSPKLFKTMAFISSIKFFIETPFIATVKTEITKTNQEITNAQNILSNLKESKELNNVSNAVVNISDSYYDRLYNPLVDMSNNKIPTMINNFKNKINESVQLAINVGNNLGNNLTATN